MKRFKVETCYVNDCVDKQRGSAKEMTSSRDATALVSKAKKVEEESKKEEEEEERSGTCVSYDLISVIGRRRVMEDAVVVAVDGEVDSYDFFAVYDGHGGAHLADAFKERLHWIIAKEVDARGTCGGGGRGLLYWEDVTAASFAKMDEGVCRGDEGDEEEEAEKGRVVEAAMNGVGSTALAVMVGKAEMVVANCGDSRAVLSCCGAAMALSRDHKVTPSHFSCLY